MKNRSLASPENSEGVPLSRQQDIAFPKEVGKANVFAQEQSGGSRFEKGLETVYRALFDSSDEALLLLNSSGAITRASRRARQLLGMKEGILGTRVLGNFFAAPFRESLGSWRERAVEGANPKPIEATLESGFVVRISKRGTAPPGGQLLVCLWEAAEAQRAEQKWKHLEAELQSLLDSVGSGVLLLDLTGQVRAANTRLGQLYGLGSRQLRGPGSFDELANLLNWKFRDPRAFSQPWRAFSASGAGPVHDELEINRPTRKVVERFARAVLDSEGRRLGWLEIHRDITSERHIPSKLFQTEKMAALGRLVSGIAHELNNPLTTIMGYTQLLLGRGLGPTELSETNKIFQEAERARRIVKNLLLFARETKPERTRADLNEIVEQTLALRSYELRIENITVESDLCPDLPPTMADPHQLQQVILNLLVNAEQALLEGRGHGQVWIRTRRLGIDRIALEVVDNGPGIPPEVASRIFDPFFTTKPPGIGTGLGLSIVYGIVHQHDGEVILENRPGGGAKFIVELPLIAVSACGAASEDSKPAAMSGEIPPARILAVEDEPTVAQLIADVLREEGHDTDAVLDSQEALTRISRTQYDLVICDLRMPRLDGQAFYETLCRAGSPLQHRIIFITGDTLAARTLEFLESTGLPYLAKPFLVEELKLAVNRALDSARYRKANLPSLAAETRSVSSRV